MSNFRVGEKVVCVNPIKELIKDKEYTISKIYEGFVETGVHVLEIEPRQTNMGGYYYYNINRFRKKQDISETTYDEVMQWIESGKPIEILN